MTENIINVNYDATGKSTQVNNYGMREMQEKAFTARNSQYILLKAPPASGKSRALMFIALDKLKTKQVKKIIVAVPERSIGKSFYSTDLKSNGFYADWTLTDEYNLCIPGDVGRKVEKINCFLKSDKEILVCTHASLRFAVDKFGIEKFNDCLVAIDEFHHVSAEYENRLGTIVRLLIKETNSHILAMTGSYFRGDGIPVLESSDESKFHKVTYNYYQQLNGYQYLKSLGIGFHFYTESYISALSEVLDTDKKTILHIPSVNSGESTKDKYLEVDYILESIGIVTRVNQNNGIIEVKRPDGKVIKVADLVNDNPTERDKVIEYLRNISAEDDIDLIIALGMAKEGFDWPYCEHALTVGYRGSLTEIIQIVGRCTRDSKNKTHAQFTNLIAEPDADRNEVVNAVNNMLKAITASLLMEQVLAPNFSFKSKREPGDSNDKDTIIIDGFKDPKSKKVRDIIYNDMTDLKAEVFQNPDITKSLSGVVDTDVINQVKIPKIIMQRYPELNQDEIDQVRDHLITDMVVRSGEIKKEGSRNFIKMSEKFINIEELNMDLINTINPFHQAFEVLSKSFTPRVLKSIQDCISAFKVSMTDDEALFLWPKINDFVKATRRKPSLDALDPNEKRLAEALIYLKQIKREQMYD
ncbi:DEAD/DEAH box helicase [Staphylococcus equorum]|uniref:DEAD/DEAH box helicase n=1 Tax=Staphylococcus equorum TaxID=246432 RepID=UPI003EB93CC7